MDTRRKVGVIGHRNPDTDSICSAIAYAALKNATGEMSCEPLRAGAINGETEYVLRRFGVPAPELCPDVSAQVMDIDIRPMPGTDGMTTVRRAWETMRDQQISTLPITDRRREPHGHHHPEGSGHGQYGYFQHPVSFRIPHPLSKHH